jgi:hypothetical protein
MNERDLFIAALEIDGPAQRAAYLDQACGGDKELRKRLDVLLAAHDESGSLEPPLQHDGDLSDHTPDADPTDSFRGPALVEGPGTIIGPYKLLQKIGEGGMGDEGQDRANPSALEVRYRPCRHPRRDGAGQAARRGACRVPAALE